MAETITGNLVMRSSKARNGQKTGITSTPTPVLIKARPISAAVMLVFGHQLVRALDAGVDRKKLAREFGLRSGTRVNQLAELASLAPDIQEEILGMTVRAGERAISEHELRKVCRAKVWEEQRDCWNRLR